MHSGFSRYLLLVPVLWVVLTGQVMAQFETPDWSNADLDGGNNNCFDIGTLEFNAINAGQLLSINTPGSAYGHGSGLYELQVNRNGVWMTIAQVDVSDDENHPVTEIATPISFPQGSISAVRFEGIPPDDCSFHDFDDPMTFSFGLASQPVPTLSWWALLALMGLTGLVASTQIRRAKVIQ